MAADRRNCYIKLYKFQRIGTMNLDYLDFEQPIAELQAKIEELRRVGTSQDINLSEEVAKLEKKVSN